MSKIPTNRFIKTARVELFQNPDRTSMDEIVKCSLEKVEKILKIYLECKIELFIVVKDTYDPSNKIFGYLWTRDFQHLSTSITKLTLQMLHVGIGCFECFIVFEKLECLDLDLIYSDTNQECSIQHVSPDFWDRFPILKSLKIRSSLYDWVDIAVSILVKWLSVRN